jgi:hypothetical protein
MANEVHPPLESGDVPEEGMGNLSLVRETRRMVRAGGEKG